MTSTKNIRSTKLSPQGNGAVSAATDEGGLWRAAVREKWRGTLDLLIHEDEASVC